MKKRGTRAQVSGLLRNIKSLRLARILSRPKRSAGHVEMIIAFVLFAVIVTFLLLYIRPYEKTTLADTILSGLENSFKDKVYTNLTSVFLRIESNEALGCVSLSLDGLDLNFNDGIILRDNGGNSVDAKLENRRLIISSEKDFFYLSMSPEFSNEGGSCSNALDVEYSAGGIVKKQLISDRKILDLKDQYDSGYDILKQELGVPATVDFAIIIGNVLMEKNIPEEVEVKAGTFYENVLYSDGIIENKKIILKVW